MNNLNAHTQWKVREDSKFKCSNCGAKVHVWFGCNACGSDFAEFIDTSPTATAVADPTSKADDVDLPTPFCTDYDDINAVEVPLFSEAQMKDYALRSVKAALETALEKCEKRLHREFNSTFIAVTSCMEAIRALTIKAELTDRPFPEIIAALRESVEAKDE